MNYEENLDIKKYVGQQIKKYRKLNKLTQKELGEKVGVKHNTISSYESGANDPEQDMLFSLAKTLGVSVDDFFPPIENSDDVFLQRAEKMMNNELGIEDMQFLRELIEKTLSMNETERAKFLSNIKFAVEYYDKGNKN